MKYPDYSNNLDIKQVEIVYAESKLFLHCRGWHFFTAMSDILSAKNVSYKKSEFARFNLFFGKTEYRLPTFGTHSYYKKYAK